MAGTYVGWTSTAVGGFGLRQARVRFERGEWDQDNVGGGKRDGNLKRTLPRADSAFPALAIASIFTSHAIVRHFGRRYESLSTAVFGVLFFALC